MIWQSKIITVKEVNILTFGYSSSKIPCCSPLCISLFYIRYPLIAYGLYNFLGIVCTAIVNHYNLILIIFLLLQRPEGLSYKISPVIRGDHNRNKWFILLHIRLQDFESLQVNQIYR